MTTSDPADGHKVVITIEIATTLPIERLRDLFSITVPLVGTSDPAVLTKEAEFGEHGRIVQVQAMVVQPFGGDNLDEDMS